MKIRKQVYELIERDLADTPVWEFALDEEGEEGQDEATVRPWNGRLPVDIEEGMFVVRATFVLADGSSHRGYLTPPAGQDDSVATIQPVIVMPAGQILFWYGVVTPTPEAIQDSYRKIGRKPEQVFPLRYRSDDGVLRTAVSGMLAGFMSFGSFNDQRVITTT